MGARMPPAEAMSNYKGTFELGQIGGRSLTIENLRAIEAAMQRIEAIDRSAAFESYADEVRGRIERLERDQRP